MNDFKDNYSLTTAEPAAYNTFSSTMEQDHSTYTTEDLQDHMNGLCIKRAPLTSSSSAFRRAACFGGPDGGFQAYRLPEDAQATELTLRKVQTCEDHYRHGDDGDGKANDETWAKISQQSPELLTMQKLIDELSHLGEMIRR